MTYADKRKRQQEHQKNYMKRKPWYKHLSNARTRCNNPNHEGYKYYGAKGIKCLLTIHETMYLFERDGGWQMKRPSLDRKDSDGNYTIKNCRFIEYEENMKLRRPTKHTEESKRQIGETRRKTNARKKLCGLKV